MCEIIAIANQKGGVGKSTTTEHLGIGLADTGKKVLVIDNDPQGDLTTLLGWYPNEIEITLSKILENVINQDGMTPDYGILHHAENIDLIPANQEMSGIEMSITGLKQREFILKEYLGTVKAYYDYILIDCNPSLGLLTVNALTAADSVIITAEASALSVTALQQLIKSIGKTRNHLNPALKVKGILFTKVEPSTNNDKSISDLVKNVYGNNVQIYETYIPKSVKLKEASGRGISIFKYAPRTKGAIAYADFVKEVLEQCSKKTELN